MYDAPCILHYVFYTLKTYQNIVFYTKLKLFTSCAAAESYIDEGSAASGDVCFLAIVSSFSLL